MIKVIKQGLPKRKICFNCRTLLEYEKEDIISRQVYLKDDVSYIICPICKEDVIV